MNKCVQVFTSSMQFIMLCRNIKGIKKEKVVHHVAQKSEYIGQKCTRPCNAELSHYRMHCTCMLQMKLVTAVIKDARCGVWILTTEHEWTWLCVLG